jgi:hypothetical protein
MAVQSDSYRTTQEARMSDFTPDEMMTLRVATRSYMESMRTNAIQFKDDPDTGHYFASESERAEELWNKLVQMDVESIGKARKALTNAIEDELRAEAGYYEDAHGVTPKSREDEELEALRQKLRGNQNEPAYTEVRTVHGPWVRVADSELPPGKYTTRIGTKHQYPK